MTETAKVVPGDTLTFTLKGKIADPAAPAGRTTHVRVFRPGKTALLAADISVNVRLDDLATFEFDVTSQFKNGVHIDEHGRYWMRRPDGWHEMSVSPGTVPSIPGTQFAPKGVQRLTEDQAT